MNTWSQVDPAIQGHVRRTIAGAVDDLRQQAGYAALSADLVACGTDESREQLRVRATRMRRIADAFEALVRSADRSES